MPTPLATYRLQVQPGFGFNEAAGVADYLAALGVTHVYTSPYLQATPGSTHGYDVLDHSRVNIELGGNEAHERMCQRLGEVGLGHVLDIVPNHMSISTRGNAWWWDVLENGQASRYAAYFDVDWHPPEAKLRDMVLLPILGDHYGRVLEAGEIKLQRDGGAFTFHYFDHVVPVAPRSLDHLLSTAAARAESVDLAFIADACSQLPFSTATDRQSIARRHRDKEVLRGQIARLCLDHPHIAAAIDEVVQEINSSPDELEVLLDRQNYRLSFWRTAGQELDYRRFFDVNTLISLRMEDDRVFQDTHTLVLQWLRAGVLDGVRIDHPDGLRDPQQYLERLRQAAPAAWIVVEKILMPDEPLRQRWPAAGTTGYEFLNRVGGLLIDPEGEQPLTSLYRQFTGEKTDYHALVREKKLLVLRDLFGSDVHQLASMLVAICERHRRYRDYTRRDLVNMLREVIACFPVYRTYVRAREQQIEDDDVRYIIQALEAAKANRPDIDADLFGFLGDILTLRIRGDLESEFVMRFQQNTGPVMAKGVEDTTFYNYNRLVALNEVGGEPGRFGISLEDFHRICQETQARWPHTMLATTTHDTKRSEDVRARISLLSEIPKRWRAAVRFWSQINKRFKQHDMPDRNAEYLLYQTLVGAWPIELDRLLAYMQKAVREAKANTSWTEPKPVYEEALAAFITSIHGDEEFQRHLQEFVQPLVEPGRINSLAQTLIKLTAPGVPDIYQGTELWDLSLVDPDNRRPVNYERRRQMLDQLDGTTPESIMSRMDEGLPKLWLTCQALHLRRRHPEWFGAEGEYLPLWATGRQRNHVVAFIRASGAITVAPRFPLRLNNQWHDTQLNLPDGQWRNELTGEEFPGGMIALPQLLALFPVALLSKQ